jgi:predicted nuclease with TOPRIM domain
MSKLTQTEINERLLRLRNLEVLYGNQTETIKKLKEENKRLKLENQQLKDENKALRERVAKLELIVEDLQKMIFKKTKKDKPAQEASLKEKTISKVRTKESYRRPIPSESQVTIVEDYSVERCGCGNKLINNIALERYIEDVILPKD